jgi:hypothetical protein
MRNDTIYSQRFRCLLKCAKLALTVVSIPFGFTGIAFSQSAKQADAPKQQLVVGMQQPPNKAPTQNNEGKLSAPALAALIKDTEVKEAPTTDVVGEGVATVVSDTGSAAFGFRVLVNGESHGLHIFLTLPNGKPWDGHADHLVPGAEQALELIETQHSRGLSSLVTFQSRNASLDDTGLKASSRSISVKESNGVSTQYMLDSSTSQLKRVEFSKAQNHDAQTGAFVPIVESFDYSDFRTVNGVSTPFKIEHQTDGRVTGQVQFTKMSTPAKDPKDIKMPSDVAAKLKEIHK